MGSSVLFRPALNRCWAVLLASALAAGLLLVYAFCLHSGNTHELRIKKNGIHTESDCTPVESATVGRKVFPSRGAVRRPSPTARPVTVYFRPSPPPPELMKKQGRKP